jgi:hypothetical protein
MSRGLRLVPAGRVRQVPAGAFSAHYLALRLTALHKGTTGRLPTHAGEGREALLNFGHDTHDEMFLGACPSLLVDHIASTKDASL